MKHIIHTPVNPGDLAHLSIGAQISLHGTLYTARDAVLPKIVTLIQNRALHELPIALSGIAILHSAFSPAGFGPTSSNKEEIESTMGILSEAGVRIHMGKGRISDQTVAEISKHGSIFIVVPPVSALLHSKLLSKRVAAFPEEGMEALHELEVDGIPGIVAAAHGESIFNQARARGLRS